MTSYISHCLWKNKFFWHTRGTVHDGRDVKVAEVWEGWLYCFQTKELGNGDCWCTPSPSPSICCPHIWVGGALQLSLSRNSLREMPWNLSPRWFEILSSKQLRWSLIKPNCKNVSHAYIYILGKYSYSL